MQKHKGAGRWKEMKRKENSNFEMYTLNFLFLFSRRRLSTCIYILRILATEMFDERDLGLNFDEVYSTPRMTLREKT